MLALESGALGAAAATKVCSALGGALAAAPASVLSLVSGWFSSALSDGSLGTGAALDLLPRVLGAAAAAPSLGRAFVGDAANTLCARSWPPPLVGRLVAALRDAPLEAPELAFLVDKTLAAMRTVALAAAPAVAYQLLLCAIRGPKRAVLDGLLGYHAWLDSHAAAAAAAGDDDADDDSMLTPTQQQQQQQQHRGRQPGHGVPPARRREAEGTTALHVAFAVQQDLELGKELLRLLRDNSSSAGLSPFAVAVALALVRIQRYEAPILDLLKARRTLACF